MSKTYNVYYNGTKIETRSKRTNNVVKPYESLRDIITRRKRAQRDARLVQILTR